MTGSQKPVLWITGAISGVGREVARQLAREGVNIGAVAEIASWFDAEKIERQAQINLVGTSSAENRRIRLR